jgi:hypothetical protein
VRGGRNLGRCRVPVEGRATECRTVVAKCVRHAWPRNAWHDLHGIDNCGR